MLEAQKRVESSQEASNTSEETRDLNMRAYQEGLVETMDVIESQLVEALMKAQNYKSLYDHAETQFRLDYTVGKEINKILAGK
jgi:outer membrane protein TolC